MATTTAQPTTGSEASPGSACLRSRNLGGNALAYAFLLLLVAIVILPFGWMTTVALKPNNVPAFTLPPEWFPTQYWHWDNFRVALVDSTQPFGRYFLNTTMIVFFNIIGTLFSCSLAAYAFARLRFRGSEVSSTS